MHQRKGPASEDTDCPLHCGGHLPRRDMTVLAFGGACTVPLTFCHHIASNFYRLLLTAYLRSLRSLRRLRYMASPSCNPTASAPSILVILNDPNSTSLALVRPSARVPTLHHTTPPSLDLPFRFAPHHPSFVLQPSSFVPRPLMSRHQGLESGGRVRPDWQSERQQNPVHLGKPAARSRAVPKAKLVHAKYGRQVRIAASYAYCTARLRDRQLQASHGTYIHITHRLDPQ